MLPTQFEGANTIFGKPADMTDEQCLPIPAYVGKDDNQLPIVITAWRPSREDIDAVLAGRPVYLQIVGGMPPVNLFTCDAAGVVNQ